MIATRESHLAFNFSIFGAGGKGREATRTLVGGVGSDTYRLSAVSVVTPIAWWCMEKQFFEFVQ